MTTHHGGESSKAIYAMAPRVAIMNNGARKGGDPKGWKMVKDSPGLEDLWQLHFAIDGSQDANVPDPCIANLEEHCEGKYLKVTAQENGSFHGLQSAEQVFENVHREVERAPGVRRWPVAADRLALLPLSNMKKGLILGALVFLRQRFVRIGAI